MRIIAGEFGGRLLVAPRGRGTRPTSDRVREAMFMALEPLAGLRVVDLYAGSGALGIEALSRGAAWADFVESGLAARTALERNLDTLGLDRRARIWRVSLPRGLARLGSVLLAADLVIADPPYGGSEARALLAGLGQRGILRAGVRVVVEQHAKDEVPERTGELQRVKARQYGEAMVTTYRAVGTPDGEETLP